jgi:hypothetical protein
MRLILAGFILIVAALHYWYGQRQPVLEIAALAAGLLLALTVVIDHFSHATSAAASDAEAAEAEAESDQPPEPG